MDILKGAGPVRSGTADMTQTKCIDGVGFICPDCGERGMVRAGVLTYRCRKSEDSPRHHLSELMPKLMGMGGGVAARTHLCVE